MNTDIELFQRTVIENMTRRTLFLLHGTGGTPTDFLFLNELLHGAYTLVGLRGNVDENGMRRFFRRLAEGVFDEESIQEESGKLDRFITAWVKKHYLTTEDTAFLGFSNGANILLSTLFFYPDHFQKMVLLHPMLPIAPPAGCSLKGKHIFVSYGKTDTMVSAEESKKVVDTLTSLGADVSFHEYPGGHGISQAEIDDAVVFLK